MDFDAQKKKRMQDIEMKRKRLEEMRKIRAEQEPISGSISLNNEPISLDLNSSMSRSQSVLSAVADDGLNDLVNSLLAAPGPENAIANNSSEGNTTLGNNSLAATTIKAEAIIDKDALRAEFLDEKKKRLSIVNIIKVHISPGKLYLFLILP